jgi:acetyl esterase/lipase
LTWSALALPQYPTPESIPIYVEMVNRLIMGTGGTPQIPMMFGQAANGPIEGTQPSPVYGAGDGVMIAGDVRTLARQYCAAGVNVHYVEYDQWSHLFAVWPPWADQAVPWLENRLNGWPATSNCASIAPGNPLTPLSPN